MKISVNPPIAVQAMVGSLWHGRGIAWRRLRTEGSAPQGRAPPSDPDISISAPAQAGTSRARHGILAKARERLDHLGG